MEDNVKTRFFSPSSWIRALNKGQAVQGLRVENTLDSESQPISIDKLDKAIKNHNKTLISTSNIGDLRIGPSNSPTSVFIDFGSGAVKKFDLFYNIQGLLDARSIDAAKSVKINNLPSNLFSPRMTVSQKKGIEKLSRSIEKNFLYSTASVPLAICRTLREQMNKNKDFKFSDIIPMFSERSRSILKSYRGGTCLTIAEQLCCEIKRRFKCNAYVVSSNPEDNILTRWPSMVKKDTMLFDRVYQFLDHDTHTNVVVPYLKGNERRYLRIDTGVGPNNIAIRDWKDNDFDEMEHEMIINNPAALAAKSARCLTKVHIKDHNNRGTFAFDILRGHLYVNKAIQETSGIPDDSTFTDLSSPLCSSELYRGNIDVLLGVVKQLFQISDESIKDLVYLFDNRQEYIDQVLIPPAASLSRCIDEADAAIGRLESAKNKLSLNSHDYILRSRIDQMEKIISHAAEMAFDNKPDIAKNIYRSV